MELNDNYLEIDSISSFDDMDLREDIVRGIYSYGFEKPSQIQSRAIMPMSTGKDIIAQAQSGTGKTGTFTIGILQRIDKNIHEPQGIIVAPTRELATQIGKVVENIGRYTGIKSVICIGGSDKEKSKTELRNSASIVVGTPGRIGDMINRGYINTKHIRTMVLDEADEMLSVSFINQIKNIICFLPENTQICLFSATMPSEILDITSKFMINPISILVKREELTLEGIRQFYINVEREEWKYETFKDLYDAISVSQSIVYVNRKNRADNLKERLERDNFTVSVIHSRMDPIERVNVMDDFRYGNTRILISTDLLSRGIDIQQVSVVINYDVPNDKESYIHRIGRSGRFGRKGVAINFVTDRELRKIKYLEDFYETVIDEMPINIDDIIRNT